MRTVTPSSSTEPVAGAVRLVERQLEAPPRVLHLNQGQGQNAVLRQAAQLGIRFDQVTQVAEVDLHPVGLLIGVVAITPTLTPRLGADGYGATGLELMESIQWVELGARGSPPLGAHVRIDGALERRCRGRGEEDPIVDFVVLPFMIGMTEALGRAYGRDVMVDKRFVVFRGLSHTRPCTLSFHLASFAGRVGSAQKLLAVTTSPMRL